MADKLITDGWASLAGGMYLPGGNHNVVGPDQAEILVNATVRRGWAEPRPAFRRTPTIWMSQEAQQSFERGIIQGSSYYDSPNGARWVYIADGHILSFDPVTNFMRVISPNGVRPFHRQAPFAWLQQRAHWMVAQDGMGPPVIIDGDNAVINEDPYNGVPTGMMMADGWHRLAVVDPTRTRIYISDHEYDPISGPLKFTDDATYFKNAKYFEIPRALGKIVAIKFAPSFNNEGDWGPLLVFCERGTRAYQLQLPREFWLNQDIAATVLPTIGACAHDSVETRGNDVIFSDHTGRIQTFKAALTRENDVRMDVADEPVWQLYKNEHASRRRWRKMARFDNRTLTTVWPEVVNLGNGKVIVKHLGIVALEEQHLSNQPFVWSGLWTGIYPVALDAGGVKQSDQGGRDERCFAVSHDCDHVNRLYELTKKNGPDLMPEKRRVPMWVIPRWLNWDTIFETKKISEVFAQLGSVRGRVTISGWWQTSGDLPREWFRREHAGGDRMLFGQGTDKRGIITPALKGIPILKFPAPNSKRSFYRARPWLRIFGEASLEETVFTASIANATPGADGSCKEPEKAVVESQKEEPNFWELYCGDDPEDTPLGIQVCEPKELSTSCKL